MKISVEVEIDTDKLFIALNQVDDLDRAKFDALVLTPEFKEYMAIQLMEDFYRAQEEDASGIEEGFFASTLVDYEDDDYFEEDDV